MAISFACPHCKVVLQLGNELLGQAVRCGSCQKIFTAVKATPAPVRTAAAVPPRPRPAPVHEPEPEPEPVRSPSRRSRRADDDDEDDRPARRRSNSKASSPSSNHGMLIGICVAILGAIFLVCIIGLSYMMRSNSTTKPIAANDVLDNMPRPVANNNAVNNVAPQMAPAADPLAAGNGKEMSAEVLRKVKAATARIDITLSNGDQGSGTGFLIHPEGLFLTNAHVVGYSRQEGNRPASMVTVILNCGERDERRIRATVFGVDGDADLALLRVPPNTPLPTPLQMGVTTGLRETQELFVFGFPLGDVAGKEITVSTTTISSFRKENDALTALQVNGGMHPGNSGGPLTDRSGQVVAIAVAGIRGTSINFAIPAELSDSFIRQQIADGGKIKPATVVGRPQSKDDSPPFMPPSRLRPPFIPPQMPQIPRPPTFPRSR